MIDFRTADSIFSSGSNARIDHCIGLCGSGELFFCHEEEKLFKGAPALKQVFIDDCDCLLFPDQAVMQKCVSVQSNPICKKLFKGNRPAIILTATAACRNFGVISDHRSPVFNTVFDLCKHFGIPTYTADEYFTAL
ncbi:hypothetical protein JQ629_18160 [Bradyrhizobium sp. AUGA SZCCT0222]|uniref:hypothetical protein n=1 Tax=Bradyrhizobium sp. AUGA SZCCT0222 TaxID=2807668 RepID=UPI001BA4DDB8|nr:hypothetical protein [Bradyrhizobium sp. AUGA SZCCT0222]MBR1269440.1 hypothetical protein [Bradyrhizobium sp. AUGA SZCCT0222]